MDTPTQAPPSDKRPTHPLKAWRETQQILDPRVKRLRQMGIADAAREAGVPYQTWVAWEKYADEPGARIPTAENMRMIARMTRLQVRPDHFYDLPTLRAERAAETASDDEAA